MNLPHEGPRARSWPARMRGGALTVGLAISACVCALSACGADRSTSAPNAPGASEEASSWTDLAPPAAGALGLPEAELARPRGVAGKVAALAGDDQVGPAGSRLPTGLRVRVLDGTGRPIANDAVRFDLVAGAGLVEPSHVTTNDDGEAATSLTLGAHAGVTRVEARAAAAPGAFARFTARSMAGPAARVVAVRGAGAAGRLGGALTIAARVTDVFGNPVAGAAVAFAARGGEDHARVDPALARTGDDGEARAKVTLGKVLGLVYVDAWIADGAQPDADAGAVPEAMSGPSDPTSTAARPLPGGAIGGVAEDAVHAATFPLLVGAAPIASALRAVDGDGQRGACGSTLARELCVVALDEAGAPLPGATIVFGVVRGDARAAPPIATTNAAGAARARLTLGDRPGPVEVDAFAPGSSAAPARFAATAHAAEEIASPPPSEERLERASPTAAGPEGEDAHDGRGVVEPDLPPPAPSRPKAIVAGYVETLRGGMTVDDLHLAPLDLVIHAFAIPQADGTLRPTEQLLRLRRAGLARRAHALGKRVLLCVGGATGSAHFSKIAADPEARARLAAGAATLVHAYGYDGVDLDWEFPESEADRAHLTLLARALREALGAHDPKALLVFGVSTGYFLDRYDFAALAEVTDYAIYFGYDWNNPANGPIAHAGTQWTIGGRTIESSVRGAIGRMIEDGYPPERILAGIPLYSSAPARSWFEARAAWAERAPPVDPVTREARLGERYWTTPEAMEAKLDALLSPPTVLAGGVRIGGVALWELGHEGRTPDLTEALRRWLER